MDFSFNKEQRMIKKAAREFLKKKCDKTVLREIESTQSGHSPRIWKEMAQLDWLGIIIPEEYEGIGWGMMELAVLFEELGFAAFDGPLLSTIMGTMMLLKGGSESQKGEVLPKVGAGKLVLTTAVMEQKVSYDSKWITASAENVTDGYRINGTKLFVPYAEIADFIFVAARTNGEPGEKDGITIFMVDRHTTGLHITPVHILAPEKLYQIDFDSVTVTSDAMIGELNKGIQIVTSVYDNGTALQCIEMVGGAQFELETTAKYTKKREQFDRPIGTFQAVQHGLADMFTDVQGARWASYQAVSKLHREIPAAKQLSIAKLFTSEACQRVAFCAQQFHGGIGIDMDYDLHFYFRRAKAMDLKFGSTEFHLKRIAEEMLA